MIRKIVCMLTLVFIPTGVAAEPATKSPSGIRSADGSKIYRGTSAWSFLRGKHRLGNFIRIYAEMSNLNVVAIDDLDPSAVVELPRFEDEDVEIHNNAMFRIALAQHGLTSIASGNVVKIYKIKNSIDPRTQRNSKFRGRLISLDLQDTKLSEALRVLENVDKTKFLGKEELPMGKKLTLRLIDVPWDQCLKIILEMVGAEFNWEGKNIRINKRAST